VSDPGIHERHATWSEIRTYVEAEAPSSHVIDGEPKITLNFAGRSQAIEARVPLDGDPPQARPLAEVAVHVTNVGGQRYLVLRTVAEPLFQYFFEFSLLVADKIQLDGVAAGVAVSESMDQWRRLLQAAAMLSPEKQLGLYGELLLLRRLFGALGSAAIDAWTGPTKAAHDFRLGDFEVEVKTTRSENRVHEINGVNQLQPSEGCELHLLSIQMAAGGTSGQSLAQLVGDVRAAASSCGVEGRFDALLRDPWGLSRDMESHYRERLRPRSPMRLIEVDGLARITAEDVMAIPRPEMQRVSDVHFRLDVTGLGWEDGAPQFNRVVPKEGS
jgi:hypothetical protein